LSDFDINDAIQAGMTWAELQDRAEEYQLRLRLRDVVDDADAVRKAFALLMDDTPLQSEYPNGERAYAPYTPRQVILLARAEFQLITHEALAYQEALARVREELGRYEPRQCEGETKSGDRCRGSAMPYSPDPMCFQHGSAEFRDYNAGRKIRESERLKEELEILGLIAASRQEKV